MYRCKLFIGYTPGSALRSFSLARIAGSAPCSLDPSQKHLHYHCLLSPAAEAAIDWCLKAELPFEPTPLLCFRCHSILDRAEARLTSCPRRTQCMEWNAGILPSFEPCSLIVSFSRKHIHRQVSSIQSDQHKNSSCCKQLR
jgi:hypothetical protein